MPLTQIYPHLGIPTVYVRPAENQLPGQERCPYLGSPNLYSLCPHVCRLLYDEITGGDSDEVQELKSRIHQLEMELRSGSESVLQFIAFLSIHIECTRRASPTVVSIT